MSILYPLSTANIKNKKEECQSSKYYYIENLIYSCSLHSEFSFEKSKKCQHVWVKFTTNNLNSHKQNIFCYNNKQHIRLLSYSFGCCVIFSN